MTRSGKRGLDVFPIFLRLATTKRSVCRSGPHKRRYRTLLVMADLRCIHYPTTLCNLFLSGFGSAVRQTVNG